MDTWQDPTEEDRVADAYETGDAFGEHDIEYWVYDGKRLVPASPDEGERLRDLEAQARLAHWRTLERRRVHMRRFRDWVLSVVAVGPWVLRAWPARRQTSTSKSVPFGRATPTQSDYGQ